MLPPAYWISSCKKSVTSVDDCASAQVVRGEAELATDAPETALLGFDWARSSGSAAARDKAEAGIARAKTALQTLLERRAPEQTWLVVVQDERALDASWAADRALLERSGYGVRPLRERASFVEAEVTRGSDALLMQWVRDSAFRFFPLVEHADFGLVLHPFDLATNKVLALVGRLEAWPELVTAPAI